MKQKQVKPQTSVFDIHRHDRRLKKTIRKRIANDKLFRKGCFGCAVKSQWDEDRGRICYMPYKSMLKCPCMKCLVKVTCTEYCDRFHETRLEEDKKYARRVQRLSKGR